MTKRLVDNFQLSKLEGSYVVPTIFMSISNHVNWSFIIEQYITIKVFIFNLWGRWTHNHLQRNEPNLVKGQTKNRKKLESCFVLVIDLGMYYLNMAILDFFLIKICNIGDFPQKILCTLHIGFTFVIIVQIFILK
jgi:hypothetical protein